MMPVETYGETRPQEGRQQTQNQDAFAIGHEPVPYVALCDGAGNAQAVASRALALLVALLKEATFGQLLKDETWRRWGKSLDSALIGGPQTTLVAAAILGDQAIGVGAGRQSRLHGPFRRTGSPGHGAGRKSAARQRGSRAGGLPSRSAPP